MSRHTTTRGPAAITTTAALAALLVGAAAGIPAGLYGITRDRTTTWHTVLLAAVVVAIAIDLLAMARAARGLHHEYRRQP